MLEGYGWNDEQELAAFLAAQDVYNEIWRMYDRQRRRSGALRPRERARHTQPVRATRSRFVANVEVTETFPYPPKGVTSTKRRLTGGSPTGRFFGSY